MVNLDIDKNAIYILAGNTGADAMALSHMLLEQEAKFVMCFVNYHIGPIWEETEQTLRDYCASKGIDYEVCDADKADQTGRDKDYEKWARKIRYDFFAEVYKKYDASALFLAHTEDDVIEGYLLSKQTAMRCENMVITRHCTRIQAWERIAYSNETFRPSYGTARIQSGNLRLH